MQWLVRLSILTVSAAIWTGVVPVSSSWLLNSLTAPRVWYWTRWEREEVWRERDFETAGEGGVLKEERL